jgi:ParB-like nuclease domain
MNFHKYANLFPLLSDTALATLAENIKAVGLFDPITTYQGQILDGRNRYRATQIAGVEPRYVEFTGTDEEAMEYSYSRNFHRRDLTAGQRAAIASEWATMKNGGDRKSDQYKNQSADSRTDQESGAKHDEEKRSAAEAAKKFETSQKSIGDIRFIKKHRPDLAEKVASGEMTINAAKAIVQKELDDKRRRAEAESKAKPETKREAAEKAKKEAAEAKAKEKAQKESEDARAEKKRIRDDHIRRVAERFEKRLNDEATKARSESGGIHKNVKDKLVAEEYTSYKFMIRSPIDFKLEPNDADDSEFHLIDAMNWVGVIPGTSWSVVEFVCRRLLSVYRAIGTEDNYKADLTKKSFDVLREHKHLFNETHTWEIKNDVTA